MNGYRGIKVTQQSQIRKYIYNITTKTAYTFCQYHIDIVIFRRLYHFLKAFALFNACSRNTLVGYRIIIDTM